MSKKIPAELLRGLEKFTVRPANRVFLGFDDHTGERRWTNDLRDSLAIIGPPGYGKTSGLLIPSLLTWDGPVISTSTRGDLLRAAGDQRQRLAAPGGRVYVYDPFNSEPDLQTMGWTPHAGCLDASVAWRRADLLTETSTQGMPGSTHWAAGASRLLRGTFHAAALKGLPFAAVRQWLSTQNLEDPVQILRTDKRAAPGWADDLEGMEQVAERERSSFYSSALNSLNATANPVVLTSTRLHTFDVDQFLRTKSTLFIVGPRHLQRAVKPMIVALVESITDRAAELAAAAGGVLDDPLLLALDEIANIAPLPSLEGLVAEGGGRGIVTIWAAQSLAAMRGIYGRDGQEAILTATTAKVIQGAMSNGDDLRNVSTWAGEWREPSATFYSSGVDMARAQAMGGGATSRADTERQHSVGRQYRPVLPVEMIQQLPRFYGWLIYQSDRPVAVRTPPSGLVQGFADVQGWTPPTPASAPVKAAS